MSVHASIISVFVHTTIFSITRIRTVIVADVRKDFLILKQCSILFSITTIKSASPIEWHFLRTTVLIEEGAWSERRGSGVQGGGSGVLYLRLYII
jgi:hypothetical protein